MFKRWLPVIALILLHFLLRANDINAHHAYIDEGYHAYWGAVIWQFDRHPANFSAGKLLLFFYLGLFHGQGLAYLLASRMAIALISCLTAVAVYQLGKTLINRQFGLLALAIYAVFPLAQFYERFAFADPIATAFVALIAWRSITFAKNPNFKQSLLIGTLLAGATSSKLTVGLIPFLPFFASFIFGEFRKTTRRFYFLSEWFKRYFVYLCIMALIVIVAWLPMIIPAYLSRDTDTSLTLVDDANVESVPRDYFVFSYTIFNEVGNFTTTLVLGGTLALALALAFFGKLRKEARYILLYALFLFILPVLTASIPATRYYMPLSVPIVLLMTLILAWIWSIKHIGRVTVGLLLGLWMAFSIPFSLTIATNPNETPLTNFNFREFQGKSLIAEKTAQEAAQFINQNIRQNELLYGDWGFCYTLYFYLDSSPTCLTRYTPVGTLWQSTLEMPDQQSLVLFALASREDYFIGIKTGIWETLGTISQAPLSREIRVWRFTRQQ